LTIKLGHGFASSFAKQSKFRLLLSKYIYIHIIYIYLDNDNDGDDGIDHDNNNQQDLSFKASHFRF
jgi:hypothetical protein